ncbi:hypothetical protein AAD018_014450 [Aestuariibius insulae]|uniref:hypothetical protein n=1 Tax=Aestuariibius insulae TaxID=2058287 RepID=UPI00345EFD7F
MLHFAAIFASRTYSIFLSLHRKGIFMKLAMVLVSLLLAVAPPVSAQDVQWALVDTGVLSDLSHGQGIEMRIQPDPVPDGLFGNENLDDLLLALCNHYAPSVIPFVQQQADIKAPDFIAVRIVSGTAVGRYVLERYAISDGKCGGAL